MTAKKKSVSAPHNAGQGNKAVEIDITEGREEDDLEASGATDTEAEAVQTLSKEKEVLYDRLLRTMAEFDNYKKRAAREKDGLISYGTEKLAREILPVLDNLERALEHDSSTDENKALLEGIRMIVKQCADVLEKFNIRAFNAVGEPFNPEKHEAMAQQEHAAYEDNTVIAELQKGYVINEKLLRPARVIVSKSPPQKGDDHASPVTE